MHVLPTLALFAVCSVAGFAACAQTPAPAATGASVTASCKDGTSWSGAQRSGACSYHRGVKAFNEPAPAGQVWVNMKSKVYHCLGDPNYGKTKARAYMTEAAAKAGGDLPSAGKTCY